jgi:hypothetical protein
MDLKIIESNDGGDLVKLTNDLAVIFGFENVPYLAMFGGNVKQSTPVVRDLSQQAFDWWGNNLFMPNDVIIQMNSETERALLNYPLTSSGRISIENAIKADLQVMTGYVNVSVDTQITSDDRLEVLITLVKPSNLQSIVFVYIWNATLQELSLMTVTGGTFDYNFEATL